MYDSKRRLRPRPLTQCPPDQIFNAKDSVWQATVTPLSQAASLAVSAAWLPLVHGQAIPMLGERGYPDDPCLDI